MGVQASLGLRPDIFGHNLDGVGRVAMVHAEENVALVSTEGKKRPCTQGSLSSSFGSDSVVLPLDVVDFSAGSAKQGNRLQ